MADIITAATSSTVYSGSFLTFKYMEKYKNTNEKNTINLLCMFYSVHLSRVTHFNNLTYGTVKFPLQPETDICLCHIPEVFSLHHGKIILLKCIVRFSFCWRVNRTDFCTWLLFSCQPAARWYLCTSSPSPWIYLSGLCPHAFSPLLSYPLLVSLVFLPRLVEMCVCADRECSL